MYVFLQGHIHVLVNRNENLVKYQNYISVGDLPLKVLHKNPFYKTPSISFENGRDLHSQTVEKGFLSLGLLFLLFVFLGIIVLQISPLDNLSVP